jgi:Spy/CpxP family protein refolding chaperone
MLALIPSAPADDPKPADPAPAKPERRSFSGRIDRLQQVAEQLKLTDGQKEKLKPIFQEEAKNIRELRQNKELSRQDRVAKLREIRKEIQDQTKPILTPEQLEKWKELRSEGPRRRKQE